MFETQTFVICGQMKDARMIVDEHIVVRDTTDLKLKDQDTRSIDD